MKQYKLIKTFPGSPELGTIAGYSKYKGLIYYEDNLDNIFKKEIVENYPEFWEEVKLKDYEILSFVNTEGNVLKKDSKINVLKKDSQINVFCKSDGKIPFYSEIELLCNPNIKIHSIKRLSDGEVFTVGDKVNNPNFPTWLIKEFIVEINNIVVVSKCGSRCYNFNNLEKSKEVLFKTEDGVDIYEGDIYYCVNSSFKLSEWIAYKDTIQEWVNNFSKKEKAEEYILRNKPFFSLNDYYSIFDGDIRDYGISSKLEKLAKSKM